MREFVIDPREEVPTIDAILRGPLGSVRTKLVFDTGAGKTQLNIPLIEALGYSIADATGIVSMSGPSGPSQDGYAFQLLSLRTLGKEFSSISVAAFDFENFSEEGLQGLLGWDVIREMNLEMEGKAKLLRVF